MKKLFAIAIITAGLAACNNSGESSTSRDSTTVMPDTATTAPAQDTASVNIDTSATQPISDTAITSPAFDKNKRYAVLGYSYFKSMRQNETRNINAYVSIINSSAKVIETLSQINSENLPERKNDTASIFTQNIILYNYLDITLIDPDGDFVIKRIHDSARQKIDSLAGNFWSWAITPKTKKSKARLILRVVAEKPDGSHELFQARNIAINISLDRGILRSIYTWLLENPEKALVLILLPFIAFFWKQIVALFGRKPKKE